MPALQINTLLDHLKNNQLSDTWINQHTWDAVNQDTSKLLVLNNILSVSTEILKHHMLVFLSGEYCALPPNSIKNDLDTTAAFLLERSILIEITPNTSIQDEILTFYYDNVIDLINNFIFSRLSFFDRDLNNQLEFESTKKLLRAHKKIEFKFSTDKIFQDYRVAFAKTIELTKLEHFDYFLAEKTIYKLLLLKKEIEILSIADFLKNALIAKIDFLQKKLFYRNKERKNRLGELIYSFDLQPDSAINLNTITLPGDLKGWEKDIVTHYGLIDDFKHLQRKMVAPIYDHYSFGNPISLFSDYRSLIKKFKDDTNNTIESELLLISFKQIAPPSSLPFDNYGKKVTLSYLFNNNISLRLSQAEISNSEFKKIFHEIRNHQNDCEIKNYFSWKKICEELTKKIETLTEDLADKQKFSSFQELLGLYSQILDKLNETLQWSTEKSFIPFQLTFNECKSDYIINTERHGDLKLFFFTSKVLPLCYESIKKEADLFNLNKLKYETLSATYKRLRRVIDDVEETSLKLRNQERRSIEVIAIFSAIALFSVGSVQIFSKEAVVTDPNVYYKFIFAFGYSLILFVLIIWVITRDDIKKIQKVHWFIIVTLILTSLFVIGYFVGSPTIFKILGEWAE